MLILIRILLILFLIFVTALCLCLFYPISYRFKALKEDKNINITGKAYWLFGLLRLTLVYIDSVQVRIYILCFKIYDSCKDKDKRKPKKQKIKQLSDEMKECKPLEDTPFLESDGEGDKSEEKREPFLQGDEEKEINKLKRLFHIAKNKISQIIEKVKSIIQNIEFYLALLEEKETKDFLSCLNSRVLKMIKHLLPVKMNIRLLVGTGNPDTTGYILALYGMVSAFFSKKQKVEINADFENSILEGFADVRGFVTIGYLLWNLVRIYFDKNFNMLRQKLKKHKINNQKAIDSR